MKFVTGTSEELKLSDNEITEILKKSFLDEGFIDAEKFESSLSPELTRNRGIIYCAREIRSNEIAGMVIKVDSGSSAKLFAKPGEVEMHLLGVLPKYRNKGVAKLLVSMLIESLTNMNYTKLLLCTQVNMKTAHRLYERFGFSHNSSRDFKKGNRDFLFYEKLFC